MTSVLAPPVPGVAAVAAVPAQDGPAEGTGHRMAVRCLAAAAILLPILSPSGPGNSSPVDLAILVAIVAMLFWAGSSRARLHLPYAIPMAVMMAAGAVAAMMGPVGGTGILTLVQDIVILVWGGTIVNVCRTPAALATFLRAWGMSAAFWAVVMIGAVFKGVSALSGVTARTGTRAAFLMHDPNMCAGYFVLSFMVVWASQYPRRRWQRMLVYTALAIAVFLTGSNGYSLALLAAILLTIVVGVGRRHGVAPSVVAGAAVLVTAAAMVTQVNFPALLQQASAVSPMLRDYVSRIPVSAEGRNQLLTETLSLYQNGGVLGEGPGAVKPILLATHAPYAFEAHSDFTAALVERGIFGFAGLLLLIAAVGTRARAALPGRLSPEFAAAVPRPWALIGGLVAVLISANIYETLHFRHVWALFGVVAALYMWGRSS